MKKEVYYRDVNFQKTTDMIEKCTTLRKSDSLNFQHIMACADHNFTPKPEYFFFNNREQRKPNHELDMGTSNISPLGRLTRQFYKDTIYPMYVGTKNKINGIVLPKKVRITKLFGPNNLNRLLTHSYYIISDFGTALKKAYFYKMPYLNVRMSTDTTFRSM